MELGPKGSEAWYIAWKMVGIHESMDEQASDGTTHDIYMAHMVATHDTRHACKGHKALGLS